MVPTIKCCAEIPGTIPETIMEVDGMAPGKENTNPRQIWGLSTSCLLEGGREGGKEREDARGEGRLS